MSGLIILCAIYILTFLIWDALLKRIINTPKTTEDYWFLIISYLPIVNTIVLLYLIIVTIGNFK